MSDAGIDNHQEAVRIVRETYMELDPTLTYDSFIDIAGSFDGTWMKLGHKSMYSAACVIELNTGLVIDFHMMSKYSLTCSRCQLKPGLEEYAQGFEEHKQEYTVNFVGSASGMEQEDGEILWNLILIFFF